MSSNDLERLFGLLRQDPSRERVEIADVALWNDSVGQSSENTVFAYITSGHL